MSALDGGGYYEDHYITIREFEPATNLALKAAQVYVGFEAFIAATGYGDETVEWEIVSGASNVEVVAEYSYDPWGRQRDPVTLAPGAPGEEPELMFGRGYTGHEHLPEYGLFHMNARLYDPQTGRFLSPDPYVQDPGEHAELQPLCVCVE